MYSANTTKELQHAATNLLSQLKSSAIQKEQIEELRAVLRFHEYRYYIQNDPLISDFEYDQLYKALEKLPELQREALILFEISGFSIKEIAGIQSSSEDAVKQRLSRGRKELLELLSEKSNTIQTVEL